MKNKAASIIQLLSILISVASLLFAINAKRDLDRRISEVTLASQKLLSESDEKQMERNKALVKFNESVGENLMSLIKRVTVLEAKNIVRGE